MKNTKAVLERSEGLREVLSPSEMECCVTKYLQKGRTGEGERKAKVGKIKTLAIFFENSGG